MPAPNCCGFGIDEWCITTIEELDASSPTDRTTTMREIAAKNIATELILIVVASDLETFELQYCLWIEDRVIMNRMRIFND